VPASLITAPPYEWPTRIAGPSLLVEDASSDGVVVVEGQRRILDDADLQAVLFEDLVHAFPAGPSTNQPWTSTTFVTWAIVSSFPVRDLASSLCSRASRSWQRNEIGVFSVEDDMAIHVDLTMLALLSQALNRARAVPLDE
jgi:hypothetical protein